MTTPGRDDELARVLPLYGGGGLRAGVNLDDSRALAQVLDAEADDEAG